MLSFPGSPLSGQSYAAPNGQIYVYDGVKWLGTSIAGGGTTTVTNNIENPFSFNVAADDSTQRVISTDELIKFVGTNGITTASDAEGAITISKISELVSVTVPTIGSTASAGEAGITYLSGGLSKWAIFTEGAFTVGEWLDVQPGWTVTDNNGFTDIIAGRGSFGAASFSTTVNDWPSPASGKTYVFTSPGGYQQGYTNPIEITVGSNNWAFGNDGSLTFPDGTTQTTAPEAFSFNVAGDDSTQRAIGNNELIKFTGAGGITTASDAEGNITINYVQGDIRSESDINIDINLSDSTLRRWRFGEDGSLTLPRGYIKNDITDGFLTIEGPLFADMVSAGEGYNSISNGVEIITHKISDDTERKFRFSWDGSLYMPTASDNSQVGAIEWRIDGGIVAQVKSSPGGGNPSSPKGLRFLTYGGDTATIISAGFTNNWTFSEDGSLTIPGDIRSEGNINIDINLSDSTLRRWSFGEDGHLIFPGGTNIIESSADSLGIYSNNPTRTNGLEIFGNTETNLFNQSKVRIISNVGTVNRVWEFGTNGSLTFPDATVQTTAFTTSPTLNILKIDDGVHEKFQELADATGTVTHDCSAGHIFYHSSPDANWTVNLTNLNLSTGYATTVTIIIDQGNTGYYPSALQVGGAAQTINWQGNTTPTPSTNRLDVVSFSILAVSGGYIVFGQLTGF
jgi:hypothetical protein